MDKGAVVTFIPAHSRRRCGQKQWQTNLPAKGITAWRGTRLGCRGPLMNCIVYPVISGDESLETGFVDFGQQVAAFRVWISAPLQNSHQGAARVA